MILIILLAIIAIMVIYFIAIYNGFIKLKNSVDEAFSTIDVYLKKRYDMIPNLVATVKGYAAHEKETLEGVVAARNSFATAKTIDEKIASDNMLEGALTKLFALSEAYPNLKANENFMTLQMEIKEVETDLAQARKYYNGTVKNFNTKCDMFPSNLIAQKMNFKKYPYFEIKNENERENVKVEF